MPVDCAALSFFHLQNYFLNELLKGFFGTGTYLLRNEYSYAKKDSDICLWPSTICAPEQIVALVRDADITRVQNNVLPCECHNATNTKGELETKKIQHKSQVCLAL